MHWLDILQLNLHQCHQYKNVGPFFIKLIKKNTKLYVCMYGRTGTYWWRFQTPLMLLGRLGGVSLIMVSLVLVIVLA